jgi:hypothetical protein
VPADLEPAARDVGADGGDIGSDSLLQPVRDGLAAEDPATPSISSSG